MDCITFYRDIYSRDEAQEFRPGNNDTLAHDKFQVKFQIKDNEGNPLEEVMVNLNGHSDSTNENGVLIYDEMGLGAYFIHCTADGYLPYTSSQLIFSDTTISVTLSPKLWMDAWMSLFDGATGNPVSRATVRSGARTFVSGSNGMVHIDSLRPGYLPFSIEHGDYFPFEDSLLVQGDTSFYVSMSNRLASVFFEIDDGTLPLVNALVKFNKQS